MKPVLIAALVVVVLTFTPTFAEMSRAVAYAVAAAGSIVALLQREGM